MDRIRHQLEQAAGARRPKGGEAAAADGPQQLPAHEAALPLLGGGWREQLLQLLWQGFEVRAGMPCSWFMLHQRHLPVAPE